MDLKGFDIRYSVLSDAPYLKQWVSNPKMLHWFPMSEEKEIEDATQCWVGFSRYSSSLTATIDGVPVGIGTLFLMPYRKVAHLCLLKMIVDPEHQRHGIGRALLKNLKHLAKNYFHLEMIHTEVVEGNPISQLLHQFGFKEIFRQKRFFKEGERYFARILLEVNLKEGN